MTAENELGIKIRRCLIVLYVQDKVAVFTTPIYIGWTSAAPRQVSGVSHYFLYNSIAE